MVVHTPVWGGNWPDDKHLSIRELTLKLTSKISDSKHLFQGCVSAIGVKGLLVVPKIICLYS